MTWSHVAYKKTQQIHCCIPFLFLLETLSSLVVSPMLSSTVFIALSLLACLNILAIVTFLSMNRIGSPTFTNRERILIRIDTATNSLAESHVDCAAFNLM